MMLSNTPEHVPECAEPGQASPACGQAPVPAMAPSRSQQLAALEQSAQLEFLSLSPLAAPAGATDDELASNIDWDLSAL